MAIIKSTSSLFLIVLLSVPVWADLPPSLNDELFSKDPAVAAKAQKEAEALPSKERRVLVLSLVEALHTDSASAISAAEALGHCGPEADNAIPALINALSFDDPAVSVAVGHALLKIGPPAIDPLGKALYDQNFLVRQRVAAILASFGPQAQKVSRDLVVFMQDPHYEVQTEVATALKRIGSPAIPYMEDALKKNGAEGRKVLVELLGSMGPDATPVLLDVVKKDDSSYVRVHAATALGAIHPPRASVLPALLDLLKDPDDAVRIAADDALGDLGPAAKAAIGPLIVDAHHEHDSLAKERSLEAVTKIGPGNADSFPGLLRGLRDEDADTRKDIINAVGQATLPPDQAISLLSVGVKDADSNVRLQALQSAALLAVKEPKAIPVLVSALSDSSPDVKRAAIRALGGKSASPAMSVHALESVLQDPSAEMRQEAIQSLGKQGPDAVVALISELKDSYTVLGGAAGKAIVAMGAPAVPALEKAKASADPATQEQITRLIKKIQAE